MTSIPPPHRPIVLAIDDQVEVLDEIEASLPADEYDVRPCRSAVDAIDVAREQSCDLILCDTHLDGTSGVLLCEQIREDPAMSRVPVMFLSPTQLPDIILRHHASGPAYHLRKPLDRTVLKQLVRRTLCGTHPTATA